MSDPRLASPSTLRLVAAAAAAVASLGVVALGVQLGTNGLVGDAPGRNPGSATASPAAAVVDRARTGAGSAELDQILLSLVPAAGAGSSGTSSTANAAATTPTAAEPASAPEAAPSAPPPGDGSTPVPPTPPVTTPPLPPAPAPAPTPTLPPELDPVVDPIIGVIDGGGNEPSGASSTAPVPVPAIQALVQELLGR
jgi:hypothetical protein